MIAELCAVFAGLYATKIVIDISYYHKQLAAGLYIGLCSLAYRFGYDWFHYPPSFLSIFDVMDRVLKLDVAELIIFSTSPVVGYGVWYLVYNLLK